MTGPAQIPWREALKSGKRITDNGGLILCGDAVCIWHPHELRDAVAQLTQRAREQLAQEKERKA